MTALEAGIISSDADRLAAFYRNGLGFEDVAAFTFPQGVVRRLRRGDARVKIFAPAAPTQERQVLDSWSSLRGFGYAALHVDDAEREVETAIGAGATMITPVTAHRPGARFALLADPEGNVWEILEEGPVDSVG